MLLLNAPPGHVAFVDSDTTRICIKTMVIANHEHVSADHRAVDRRATDHPTVDLRLVHRPRIRHIVRDAHPRLPERLREYLRNANLGYRERRHRDQLYRPVLNDKENNDIIRRLC